MPRRRIAWSSAWIAIGCLCLASAANAAPPANDNFANAELLTGSEDAATGDTTEATSEAGEPAHAGEGANGNASIWFRWQAPATGVAIIETCGSDFDTVLAVYTGSLGSLTGVASNDDGCGLRSSVSLDVQSGTTYSIAIDGYAPEERGAVALSLSLFSAPPPNDNFTDAEPLSGTSDTRIGRTLLATREADEPTYTSAGSVWYSWTAPAAGTLRLNVCDSDFSAHFQVYAGWPGDQLRTQGPGRCERYRSVTAGTTYSIAVQGDDSEGRFMIALDLLDPPPNDNFANAITLTGTSASASGENVGATEEPHEPDLNTSAAGASVWYSWTAPADGAVRVDVCDSDFYTRLAVFIGPSVISLGLPEMEAGCLLHMPITAGTTYRILVDGGGYEQPRGTFELALDLIPLPVNDNFADAESLSGRAVSATGNTYGATFEDGEPNHGGGREGSAWYAWVAPATAVVQIDHCASDFNAAVALYSGTVIDNLARQSPVGTGGGCRALFKVVEGVTYRIAVTGWWERGNFEFGLEVLEPAGNDDFANPTILAGASATAPGDTRAATVENGEPVHHSANGTTSVWYSWTAPWHGTVRIDVCATTFASVIAVYTGTTLSTLTKEASTAFCVVQFMGTAGTTYGIAVDGDLVSPIGTDRRGTFTLELTANPVDGDGDGVPDHEDNCPGTRNGDQANSDGRADGGDLCDTDLDNDSIADNSDNCPGVSNPDQANSDGRADGGDACDTDLDNDSVADNSDNCPGVSNPDQANGDQRKDGGDVCDTDLDNDRVTNIHDVCPTEAGPRSGTRRGCPPAPPITDVDNDGVGDPWDKCPAQSDLIALRSPRTGCPADPPTPPPAKPAKPAPTSGNDTLTGDALANVICGLGGDDTIDGKGGNDTLFGDACGASAARASRGGNDKLIGGKGDDKLSGGPGVNTYSAGPGDDTINARNGKEETISCGPGKDKATVDKTDTVRGCERVKRPKRRRDR